MDRPLAVPIERAPSMRFAVMARRLADSARRAGLVSPSFRSPPKLAGVDRALHGRGPGSVVAVRVRGRPFEAVLADMIEGIVNVNGLAGPAASRARARLWETALEEQRAA
jgi:hypothetical protein